MTKDFCLQVAPSNGQAERLVIARDVAHGTRWDSVDIDSADSRRKYADDRSSLFELDREWLDSELCRLAKEADEKASAESEEPPEVNPFKDRKIKLIRRNLSTVVPQEVVWHWPGRIAQGKLSIISGDPGIGKSFLSLDVVARTSRGSRWPDCEDVAPIGSAIVLNAEDGVEDVITPRLIAAGADMSKVEVIEGVKGINDAGLFERQVDLIHDIALVEEAIQDMPNCRLVVIDPISAYCGDIDSHKNAEVRGMLAPLAAMASRRNVSIIAVSHLTKKSGPAMYRTMGSLAFVAAARAAWAVVRDKDDPSRRLFLPVKNNLAADTKGLAFGLDPRHSYNDVPVVAWEAGEVDIAADEAMGEDKSSQGTSRKAAEWLRDLLADGPVIAKEVKEHAEADGISERTLMRAKSKLGIESSKDAFCSRWTWSLPGSEY